eukprot:s2994_g2.t1
MAGRQSSQAVLLKSALARAPTPTRKERGSNRCSSISSTARRPFSLQTPGDAPVQQPASQEFTYKDDTYKSACSLHQYCAMEGLSDEQVMEQLSAVDAVLDGMKHDSEDWWAVQAEKQLKVHALHVATFYGHAALVRKLLQAAADANVQEKKGEEKRNTALHVAVWYDRPEVIKVLLEKRANPSILVNRFTPLHFAARLGNAEAVKGILDSAKQLKLVEDRNEEWKTTTLAGDRPAIQLACEAELACEEGDSTCFELLLQAMEEESADGSADYWNSATSKDNQKKLVSFAFKERPFIASLMLKHYHEMAVVRELLNGQEVAIITQILQNSADWKTVLDNFVKQPGQMLSTDGTHATKCNRANFWKQNFTNRWNGMAFLCGDVRSARHPRKVLDYADNQTDDLKRKLELALKLKGSNGFAMAEKFVEVGLIPIDADQLARDEILRAIAVDANYSLLSTKFVRAVLDDSWAKVKVWYFWHVFWAFFQVVMACVLSASLRDTRPAELPDTGGQVPTSAFILLSMVWVKRLIEELYQLVVYWCSCRRQVEVPAKPDAESSLRSCTPHSLCSSFFLFFKKNGCSFHTVLDWFYLLVSGGALYYLWPFDGPFNAWPMRRSLIAFYFTLVWLSALYWLRGVAAWGFSEKLLPILWAMRDTGTFLIVVSFTFAAAVHSYFVLSIPNMPPGLYRALEKTFRLGFLGDFDLYELEFVDPIFVPGETAGVLEPEDPQPGEDHPFVHLFFYIVAFGITIVQMNLFIGILSANYDKYSMARILPAISFLLVGLATVVDDALPEDLCDQKPGEDLSLRQLRGQRMMKPDGEAPKEELT